MYRGLGEPWASLDGDEKSPPQAFDTRTVQSVAGRHADEAGTMILTSIIIPSFIVGRQVNFISVIITVTNLCGDVTVISKFKH
jgi:hypothetical protein